MSCCPNWYSCHLIFCVDLSVGASSDRRGSICIPSTPPSVYPSHMKFPSREDVPWVSLHQSGSIRSCIHFSSAVKVNSAANGGCRFPKFRLSFLTGWLQVATAGCPDLLRCSVISSRALGFAKTNTWTSSACVAAWWWPLQIGIIYLPFALQASCFLLSATACCYRPLLSLIPFSSQRFLTRLNISCHAETTQNSRDWAWGANANTHFPRLCICFRILQVVWWMLVDDEMNTYFNLQILII